MPPRGGCLATFVGAFRDPARTEPRQGGRNAPGLQRNLASKSPSIGALGWLDSRREDALARLHRDEHCGFLRGGEPLGSAVIATRMSCRQGAAAVSCHRRSGTTLREGARPSREQSVERRRARAPSRAGYRWHRPISGVVVVAVLMARGGRGAGGRGAGGRGMVVRRSARGGCGHAGNGPRTHAGRTRRRPRARWHNQPMARGGTWRHTMSGRAR